MPNSKNMNDKTSTSRTKARTSPDKMDPSSERGQVKGTGEMHGGGGMNASSSGSSGTSQRVGSSSSQTQERVGSAPVNPGRTNRTSKESTGSFSHGSSSESSTGRGAGSNSRFGSSDEGTSSSKRNS